ncbi:MAG: protease inhibitor I9 family protein [Deltaproteobacteria bacterium]|nr:protease inhibitor I9 family protein [Deltaproteobacteria bacterium]
MKKFLWVIILSMAGVFFTTSDSSAFTDLANNIVPGRYIVVFHDTLSNIPDVANEMAENHGLSLKHIYTVAIKGFSATIPIQSLNAIKDDSRVKYIAADKAVYAMPKPPDVGPPDKEEELPPPQEIPTA